MSRNRKPQVAIVGRPNVGKSAVFNRLAGRRIAIVHDEPGVTRDRIATECKNARIPYELTDTGGIGAVLTDGFADQVRTEADIAIHAADLILFTVDAREGVHPIDLDLANVLRTSGTPVILLVNKVDTAKTDNDTAEFVTLGFETQLDVSAAHGRNFGELEHSIFEAFEKLGFEEAGETDGEEEVPSDPVKIAIVGRPNVGKSSLVNAILNDERSIVSDIAGTTRDALDVPYEREGIPYLLIDTAGIRKRTRRDTSVEVFSVMRSERSIRRADICLLVIDASSGVTTQDRRIAKMVIDENKPCIVLLNKFDLYHPDAKYQDRIEQFREELGDDLFFLPYAPKVAISAKYRDHLGRIFESIQKVVQVASDPIPTGVLNRLLQQAIERNQPPVRHSKRLKLLYATQKREDEPQTVPVPEYLLFVNHSELMTRTYERYLENQIRREYPMEGLPFVFRVKSRISERKDGKRTPAKSAGGAKRRPAKEGTKSAAADYPRPGKAKTSTTGQTTKMGRRRRTNK
ncbi:MAG: ribosome biogenesis GTPase Der [Verrucomicrobiales bacterium]|jgi:GTP-binding protein|nr:ribosome biogenesis GTPase Der [Verrucomicrobiales bacterium]HQZ27497.1 ribosome biogenesis GTPase Der [Verrucomicrobiales bacterium]